MNETVQDTSDWFDPMRHYAANRYAVNLEAKTLEKMTLEELITVVHDDYDSVRLWTVERIWRAMGQDRAIGRHEDTYNAAWRSVAPHLIGCGRYISDTPHPKIVRSYYEYPLGIEYIGNRLLLSQPVLVPLICHRADAMQYATQREAVLNAARHGAVVVTAMMSRGERDIAQQIIAEELPLIEIHPQGLGDPGTPTAPTAAITSACITGLRLVISPWHRNTVAMNNRPACLVMNALVTAIAGYDDWWKKMSRG